MGGTRQGARGSPGRGTRVESRENGEDAVGGSTHVPGLGERPLLNVFVYPLLAWLVDCIDGGPCVS